jgi:hypothetical protein
VKARGDLRLAGTIQATQQVPAASQQQAVTPYMLSPSSGSTHESKGAGSSSSSKGRTKAHKVSQPVNSMSAQNAADELQRMLTAPDQAVTAQSLVSLFCNAGGLGPDPRPFDPALCTGLELWVKSMSQPGALQADLGHDMWMAAAYMQAQLHSVADRLPELAHNLLGLKPGAVTLERMYLT